MTSHLLKFYEDNSKITTILVLFQKTYENEISIFDQ